MSKKISESWTKEVIAVPVTNGGMAILGMNVAPTEALRRTEDP